MNLIDLINKARLANAVLKKKSIEDDNGYLFYFSIEVIPDENTVLKLIKKNTVWNTLKIIDSEELYPFRTALDFENIINKVTHKILNSDSSEINFMEDIEFSEMCV